MKINAMQKLIMNLLIERPMGVTELKNKIHVSSFGTISYHLKELSKKGVIEAKKEKNKQGQPTVYFLKTKKEDESYNDIFFRELNTFQILNVIKKANKPLSYNEVHEKSKVRVDPEYYLEKLNNYGLIDTKYNITKRGLEFLKKINKNKLLTEKEAYEEDYGEPYNS